MIRPFLFLLVVLMRAGAARADVPLLQPFGTEPMPPSPWHLAGLPDQRKPFTRFELIDLDGRRALRVASDDSYGNLVHPVQLEVPSGILAWRWRVDQLVEAADLRTRAGDDTAVKVCVFFDEPMADVPFVERQMLRLARLRSAEWLPSATVCYVWDNQLPVGTALPNAYTRRMRYLVLESGKAHLQQWRSERRDVAADFMRLFGGETRQLPAIVGVGIGGDADNTHGHGIAHVADLTLEP